MRALQKQHIVDVFVLVDDCLPKQIKPGAHSILTDSELLTTTSDATKEDERAMADRASPHQTKD